MGRIEKALEKAAAMRGSIKEPVAEEKFTTERKVPFKGFEIKKALINPDKVDRHIVCVKDPASPITEQYKKLRARIIKTTEKDFLNTIMVTSPGIGEGKTVTAINLAIAMAHEIDYTVLLVDADLKNPTVDRYLGVESKYGLSDYLMNRAKLQDILLKTGIGKLVLLPAGKSSENTAELLSSERMRTLVQELKLRYNDRYVIFDAPPMLVVAESLQLSSYMDGIVMVVQAAKTTPKTASNALSLIKGSNILGIVLNNVPKEFAKNLFPYYYNKDKERLYQASRKQQQKR